MNHQEARPRSPQAGRVRRRGWIGVLLAASVLASWGCSSKLPQNVRCVFIDAGAHRGQSYSAFQRSGLYSKYYWEIFAIEANPHMIEGLPAAPNLTIINKAIWIDEGTMDFNLVSETSGANSLYEPDVDQNYVTISVETFDFSQWLQDNFSKEDTVVLSMDIEGAEFDVFKKMLDDRTVPYIDRLYVEVHPWLLKDMPLEKARNEYRWLLNEFHRRGVAVVEDSVEDAMKAGLWLDFLLEPPVRPTPTPTPTSAEAG